VNTVGREFWRPQVLEEGVARNTRFWTGSVAPAASLRSFLSGLLIVLLLALSGAGCAPRTVKQMEVTAYCGCGQCCGWERGSWKYLKLNFWNRYVSSGPHEGRSYSGRTASGTKPHEPRPGLLSLDTIIHPWMLPLRLVFPWRWFARAGTIAADTDYYAFGTRMYVPGYGYGKVEDRGSAIRGPKRLDIFIDSHDDALEFGRQKLDVRVND
jgi:hypothetical protein